MIIFGTLCVFIYRGDKKYETDKIYSFDVNDISLDDVPTSQHELDQRMTDDPNLNLAGGSDSAESVSFDGSISSGNAGSANIADDSSTVSLSIQSANSETIALDNGIGDPTIAPSESAAPKAEPSASFVAGDIIDEPDNSSDKTSESDAKAKEELDHMEASFGQINVDPIAAEGNEKSDAKVTDQVGAPSSPTETTAKADSADNAATPAGEPAHVANTITSPEQKKSKAPLFIGIGVGVAVIIIAIVVLLVVIK